MTLELIGVAAADLGDDRAAVWDDIGGVLGLDGTDVAGGLLINEDGVIYSDGTTILGGDDKSGICAILEAVRGEDIEAVGVIGFAGFVGDGLQTQFLQHFAQALAHGPLIAALESVGCRWRSSSFSPISMDGPACPSGARPPSWHRA